MSNLVFEPEAALLRYPIVSPAERDDLVRWVRLMDSRTLVRLLSDRRTEQQLLALRSREPKLQDIGVRFILILGAPLLLLIFLAAHAAFDFLKL